MSDAACLMCKDREGEMLVVEASWIFHCHKREACLRKLPEYLYSQNIWQEGITIEGVGKSLFVPPDKREINGLPNKILMLLKKEEQK